jgi:hypothetical protein
VVMPQVKHAGQNHSIKIGNIAFMKKLRADWRQGLLAIIWCRIFCLISSGVLKILCFLFIPCIICSVQSHPLFDDDDDNNNDMWRVQSLFFFLNSFLVRVSTLQDHVRSWSGTHHTACPVSIGGGAAEPKGWSLAFGWCQCLRKHELCLFSPIHVHDVSLG